MCPRRRSRPRPSPPSARTTSRRAPWLDACWSRGSARRRRRTRTSCPLGSWCEARPVRHREPRRRGFYCCASMAGAEGVADRVLRDLAGCFLGLRKAPHHSAQAEVARQVGGEAPHAQSLAGVEDDLASGEVREDGAGGVDRLFTLETNQALAPLGFLLLHRVQARLPGPGAADRQPVPVEDESLVGAQQLPRLRRQVHVEAVAVHVISLPKSPGAKPAASPRSCGTDRRPRWRWPPRDV